VRSAFLACILAVLTGCAVQTAALREHAPEGLAPRAELASTPFFPQTGFRCGPAALATVLASAGMAADPDALAEQVFLPARDGTLQAEMLAGARRQGLVATRLPPELSAVLQEVQAGHPVAVLLNLGLDFVPVWHYAVLVGYDLPEGEVVLRSGVTKREVMRMRTFEHTWARSGHWSFVALPAGEWPQAAREADVLEAALGFERVAAPRQSQQAYEAALRRWPGNVSLAMGRANAIQAGGDLPQAADAFRGVAERFGLGAAWVNLAQVQLERGDRAAAREAAARAVDDARWGALAREVLERAR
jgi:hypothetical protein